MKSILLALVVASTLAVIPTKVENCGTVHDIVFTAATFSVQPAKGVDETITLYGTAQTHVELEVVEMKAKWSGAEVFKQDFPNDNIYDEGDPVTFTYSANFPTYTPSGQITVDFNFEEADRAIVGCARVFLNL